MEFKKKVCLTSKHLFWIADQYRQNRKLESASFVGLLVNLNTNKFDKYC
jgi:hypothetical protein